ncbi:MAG: synthase subcomplex delta subunit [Chthonomonadaceae bacterium]|nr:synthase subcomplex delta subunit [Chthonomonadaceae bacterium]
MAEYDLRAARRYATALFATAQKQNTLAAVESDLATVLDLMQKTPALFQLWHSQVVPGGRKRDLISKVLGESISPLGLSFLRLLIDKRREEILEPVRDEFHRLTDAANHLLRVEATFAVQPTPAETQSLVGSLEKRTGEHVELKVLIDPAILGGVIVRMNDNILDGSVRGTLERLREQLLQEV